MNKSTAAKHSPQSQRVNSLGYLAVLLVNIILFVCIGWVYLESTRNYSRKIFDENVKNVENLNAAAASAAATYTSSMGVKLDDLVAYVRHNALDADAVVAYMGVSNTDPHKQFQLVRSGRYGGTGALSFGDYSGVSVRKVRKEGGGLETVTRNIVYGSGYYDILRSFTDVRDEMFHGICVAPEFTDPDTKLKCFAVYRHLVLPDATGKKTLYTALLAVNSRTALNAYNMRELYDRQSTVLINHKGDYIIKNSNYRNANFYDYIVNYNGLSQRWKAQIRTQVLESSQGAGRGTSLFYKNHRGEDCVFSVAAGNSDWYSITCVPLSSFNMDDSNVNYSLIILMLFLALFLLDGTAAWGIWKTLRHNVAVAERATAAANEASQAKSRFLSTMSHELRTPLNAIIGFISLSMDSIEDKVVLRDYLKKIDIASKLLLQLIGDILDISAIESNKIKINKCHFDITKIISSLSAIYYAQCMTKNIDFAVVVKNIHAETCIGDPVRVNQVLLNLLSNAVKFTPEGGSIRLTMETIERENATVVIRFDVEDTGCGISDELKARLFQPFERGVGEAARRHGGTGLGLSIAKKLVGLMHGRMGMESREGAGAHFWVEIPFTAAETPQRRFSPLHDLRVLAVVCTDGARENLGRMLATFGVGYRLADTAGAALALLHEAEEGGRPFSLCILDWKMADLNALDGTRRLRQDFDSRRLRIMVLAYDLAEVRMQCLDAGADLVLGKPVFPSNLYDTLVEITGHAPRAIPDAAPPCDALRGKRALLVEDNQINIEIARLMLGKFGMTVETAENGRLGCERFSAAAAGHFDVILMDIQMPVMNGYEAARAIRAGAHPDARTIPILAMTADAFSDDVARSRDAGMNEHLSKPIEPDTLQAVLRKHLCRSPEAATPSPPTLSAPL